MTTGSSSRRSGRRLLGGGTLAALVGIGIGLAAWADPDSSPARPRTPVVASASVGPSLCPRPLAAARAGAALVGAEQRFLLEAEGEVIHRDLRRIAADAVFVQALGAHDLTAALAAANRQLVRHVVRIRVLGGGHVLVDANPSSFDVGGAGLTLRGPGGARLGRLQITVQDVIGFDKLVHKLIHADVVVRSSSGRMRTTLAAAAMVALPSSGCATVGGRTYVVGSFAKRGFAGERLTVWVLTPA